jgi:hypothetical protein
MKQLIHQITAFIFQTRLRLKLFYLIMFLLFGTIIGTATFAISHHNLSNHIDLTLLSSGQKELQSKSENLTTTLSSLHQSVVAAKSSTIFRNYLADKTSANNRSKVNELFYSLSVANPLLSQLRYIDARGNETVRIDRERLDTDPLMLPVERLQNKRNRYYFQATAQLDEGKLWYSKVDLNVEHGKIVRPLVPTLRIASPVYRSDTFEGIVIANFFMELVLQSLTESASARSCLKPKTLWRMKSRSSTNTSCSP